jgi:hypothetical protein
MLKFTCGQRINVDDALAHPYFTSIRDAKLETESTKPLNPDLELIEEDENHLYDSVSIIYFLKKY